MILFGGVEIWWWWSWDLPVRNGHITSGGGSQQAHRCVYLLFSKHQCHGLSLNRKSVHIYGSGGRLGSFLWMFYGCNVTLRLQM